MNNSEILRVVTSERSGEAFYIHYGLTPKQIRELIAYTRVETDPIKLDGDNNRFMSLEQYEVWKQKERIVYALTNSEDEGVLMGIFWAGRKELPVRVDYTEYLDPQFYQHTYAFRLYGSARGKGLSHAVLESCMADYTRKFTLPLGSWLEVNGSNPAALRMDQKMGYRVVSGLNDRGMQILARTYAV